MTKLYGGPYDALDIPIHIDPLEIRDQAHGVFYRYLLIRLGHYKEYVYDGEGVLDSSLQGSGRVWFDQLPLCSDEPTDLDG